MCGKFLHGHYLAGIIVYAANHHHGNFITMFVYGSFEICRINMMFAFSWCNFDEMRCRIESVKPQL